MDQERTDAVVRRIRESRILARRTELQSLKTELRALRDLLRPLVDRMHNAALALHKLDHELAQEETTVVIRKLHE